MRPAHKDEAPELAGGGGFREGHTKGGTVDSAEANERRKTLAGLAAEAALHGIEVVDSGADIWALRDHARAELVGYVVGLGALRAAVRGLVMSSEAAR